MRVRARTPQNWPSVPGHRTRHDITTALSFAAIACGCGRAGYPPTVADPLGDPAARERLLASIAPDSAAEHHAVLRDIFRREMHHRHDTGVDEFFENLYWCAFLLHPICDPADVPMMWQAKHTDFDTAAGFDVQFLLGAGAETTLTYLTGHGHADIARELLAYPELHEDLQAWTAFRRSYFYGHG